VEKKAAIVLARRHGSLTLGKSTTRFANVNASKAVWWLDIPVDILGKSEHLDMLLATTDDQSVHHMRVSTRFLRDNIARLNVRLDKGTISLELGELTSSFVDLRPAGGRLPFAQFLVATYTQRPPDGS
jgi:hypothetical protein